LTKRTNRRMYTASQGAGMVWSGYHALDHTYRAMAWLGEEIADGRTTTDATDEDLYRPRQGLFV